jgi:hypothetical protein
MRIQVGVSFSKGLRPVRLGKHSTRLAVVALLLAAACQQRGSNEDVRADALVTLPAADSTLQIEIAARDLDGTMALCRPCRDHAAG